ncbi:hypothetical protein BI364_09765 [Acidihalobacter yilgarnensis]|uniref:YqhA family protein n=1 Tax=Acidihalobacter yilgarnensis TaxID=2819280 RepID=A0A1D8IPA1_9GAMM|nr:YqhA family protein [Acidihalobacter yilgarnensis]AOU98204.1 hypothetical protein BI364_09765 [Acidihalobacter yilgarnensis]
MNRLERLFEGFLWRSRLVVLAAVVASLASALAMFYTATIDAWYMIVHLSEYASPSLTEAARAQMRGSTIAYVVEILDGYLLATVLLIFALGLYELFISKIDEAERSEMASKVLVIHSLDDLKARLGKVVLMILIVKFFEHALGMKFASPLDLLYFAGGIALIGLALYFSHSSEHKPGVLSRPRLVEHEE